MNHDPNRPTVNVELRDGRYIFTIHGRKVSTQKGIQALLSYIPKGEVSQLTTISPRTIEGWVIGRNISQMAMRLLDIALKVWINRSRR